MVNPIFATVIQGHLPSLNEVIAAARGNRYVAGKQKKQTTEMIAAQTANRATIPGGYWLFVWFARNKRTDPDNISGGGSKAVLDGISRSGVIENDGWKQVRGTLNAYRIAEDECVMVFCYERAEDAAQAWLSWQEER